MSKRNLDADAVAEPKTKKPKLDDRKVGAPVVRYGTLLTPRQERLCRGDARYVSVSDLVTQYEEQMNFRYYFVEDEEKKKWCIDLDMRWFKSCDKKEKIEQLVLAIQSKRDILTVQLIKEERENV